MTDKNALNGRATSLNGVDLRALTGLMFMPTIVTHGFIAALLGKSLASAHMPARFWFLSVLCSILPDADVLGFSFGIRYGDTLGHRGLSHSLVFALVSSLIVAFMAFPRLPQGLTRLFLIFYFFVVTASHGILDAMTDGGLGIAFFAPFSDARYFFPVRPIKVSPIGLSFFSVRGLEVIWSEFLWVCLPATIIAGPVMLYRKLRRRTPVRELEGAESLKSATES